MSFARPQDFCDFDGNVYLNAAYKGPMPRVAVEAGLSALEIEKKPHLLRDEFFFSYPDDYRAAAAALIGGDPASVAVTDSTTHGIMLLVNGLDWRAGDEVVIPEGEFPSNRFPWLSLEKSGVRVIEVDMGAADAGVERLQDALTERTRVISLSWVAYDTGLRRDLGAIGTLCRDSGVLFAVDGTQGVGGLAFDLTKNPCDLLACSAYKWMLGPYGRGFAYLEPELAERLETANVNWFAVAGARDFSRLSKTRLEYEAGARRFDVNEAASFVATAQGTASLGYLQEVGPAVIEEHVRALQDRLIAGLPEGVRVVSDLAPGCRSNLLFLAASSEQATAALDQRLRAQKFAISRREGSIRVAPHIYNTEDEIDRLLEVASHRTFSGQNAS